MSRKSLKKLSVENTNEMRTAFHLSFVFHNFESFRSKTGIWYSYWKREDEKKQTSSSTDKKSEKGFGATEGYVVEGRGWVWRTMHRGQVRGAKKNREWEMHFCFWISSSNKSGKMRIWYCRGSEGKMRWWVKVDGDACRPKLQVYGVNNL